LVPTGARKGPVGHTLFVYVPASAVLPEVMAPVVAPPPAPAPVVAPADCPLAELPVEDPAEPPAPLPVAGVPLVPAVWPET
jgi:hypothetical protein